MTTPSPWIKSLRAVPDAKLRLFCLPHAGGGAWSYRPWGAQLPDHIELVGLQPPGREDRLMHEPIPDVHDLAGELATALEPLLDKPYAVFGHSMGAIVIGH